MKNTKSKLYSAVLIALFSSSAFAQDLTQDSSKQYQMKPISPHELTSTTGRQVDGYDIIGRADSTIYLECSPGYTGVKYKQTRDYGNTWEIVNTCAKNVPEVRGQECKEPMTGLIYQSRMRTDYEDGRPSTYSDWTTDRVECAAYPVETIKETSNTMMACPAGMTPAENQSRSVGRYTTLSGSTVSYNYYDKVLALAEGPSEMIMARTATRYSDGSIKDYSSWKIETNNCYRAGLENENEDCHTGGPGMSATSANVVNITFANVSQWGRTGLVGRTDMVWVKIPGSVSTQPGYMLGIWDLRSGNGKLNRFERAMSEMAACSGA